MLKKYRPRIDIREGYGYNISGQDLNGQPKIRLDFPFEGITALVPTGRLFFMVIVTDLISRNNAKSIIRNLIMLHTSFWMVC